MSSKDSWATPMPVYLALDCEFNFVADICASESNAKHPQYLTELDDALSIDVHRHPFKRGSALKPGSFVYCNPPYSKITPWIELAAKLRRHGVGVVMLVMADSSVGWYYDALQQCDEIREVVKGRLAFINPDTGRPVSGNSKGSLILVFEPYGRQSPPLRTYVERDHLMAAGVDLMTIPTLLFGEVLCEAD